MLTVPNRSAIIDYHVSINYLILRCQPIVISLSLSLSLSEIVTSMLISRCQTIVSLSLTHTSSPRCLFPGVKTSSLSLSPTELSPRCLFPGVKPSSLSLSLSHNCHPDAYFQLSNHCLSFPEVVTSMLISRCRTIVYLSLSLSHRDHDLDFLPAHTNKQSAGNWNALCVAVAP